MSQWALPCKDSLHRLAVAHTCPSFTWPAYAPPHGSPTSDAESSTSACSLIDFRRADDRHHSHALRPGAGRWGQRGNTEVVQASLHKGRTLSSEREVQSVVVARVMVIDLPSAHCVHDDIGQCKLICATRNAEFHTCSYANSAHTNACTPNDASVKRRRTFQRLLVAISIVPQISTPETASAVAATPLVVDCLAACQLRMGISNRRHLTRSDVTRASNALP